jgi:hypothetical protein
MNALTRYVRVLLSLCCLAVGLASPRAAHAGPLTPWPGERTPTGTLLLVPSLFVSGDGKTFDPLLYGATGLGDAWDVYVGLGGSIGLGLLARPTLLDVFPRYHLTPETALVLRAQLAPEGRLAAGAEVHSTLKWGAFSLVVNAGVRPEFNFNGSDPSAFAFAILGPEYAFSPRFSVYCELNPLLAFIPVAEGDPASPWSVEMAVVPGISFSLDPEQNHQFSIGAEIALPLQGAFDYPGSVTFGVWYATSFDFGATRKEPEPEPDTSDAAARLSSRG